MDEKVTRKLFLGFIQMHILYHAKNEPIYGAWMKEELEEHGYEISSGTLYPLLNRMEKDGLLTKEDKVVNGKVRKYYTTTEEGLKILKIGKKKAYELFHEIID